MKEFVVKLLTRFAREAVERHRPMVIGITGSQGKTSTRLAIADVLKEAGMSVRTPEKNYNNEFGFPLGILGLKSPGHSAIGWLVTLLQARRSARNGAAFPKVLVLEYGVDKKGDMAHLLSIAKPNIAVLTGVSAVHVENYPSLEDLVREKAQLGEIVSADGTVIVNADDARAEALVENVSARVLSYGFSESSDVRVLDTHLDTRPDEWFGADETVALLSLTVKGERETYALSMRNVAGRPVALAAACAIAVAERLHADAVSIVAALSRLDSAPGRMRLLPGIKGTLILDDTYNASPAAMRAALETLADFDPVEGARRIAVLGHMAELGRFSEDEHRQIGFAVEEMGVQLLACVGEKARDIARAAKEAGMSSEMVQEFESPSAAGHWLDHELRSGDVVLVKGSQSARMEKVVKAVMAEPLRAEELLVRQDAAWLEI